MSDQTHKLNSPQFIEIVDKLRHQPWLGNRIWWTNYLYHFTDIKNAVSVLNAGFLYSRNDASDQNLIVQDSASPQIIDNTENTLTGYVRFYFRPLTPTAYMNEGFRPQPKLYQGAHCPVPIYFLFDLREVITLKDTSFSDGSLARRDHRILNSSNDFARLPFRDIYHNVGWGHEDQDRQDEIKNRRHAEVIHPHRISLDHLTYIVCRSQAEYKTLYNLLSSTVWSRWKNKVAVGKNRMLFNNEWLFVKEVTLSQASVKVGFNFPDHPRFYGPFSIRVDVVDNLTGVSGYFEQNYQNIVFELRGPQLEINISDLRLSNYTARISIDDILAYLGKYEGDEIPF